MPIGLPPGLDSLLGAGSGQTWKDRLREAAYTSPKGTRIRFKAPAVSRSTDARGTVWEFAGVNEAYVQRRGFGPRQYPILAYFAGPDHDKIATAFFAALLEDGVGKLEHPTYGEVPNVVPFGTITQRDDLVSEANQSVLEVTFWTTLREIYPNTSRDAKSEIEASVDDFDASSAGQFAAAMDLGSRAKKANAAATITGFLKDVSATVKALSDATSTVRREFDDANRILNSGIDVFVGQPLLLAQQISNLIKAPARAAAGIQSRLDGYADLADRIFGSSAGTPGTTPTAATASALTKRSNDFKIAHLMAFNAVAGAVLSLINHTFRTKPEVLKAANDVTGTFDDAVASADDGFAALGEVDTGESYQALLNSVALAAGFLVEASFSLVPERRIVLDRNRTIIDLAAQLYGSVDGTSPSRIDQLIADNNLTGRQILELQAGDVIRYYPET